MAEGGYQRVLSSLPPEDAIAAMPRHTIGTTDDAPLLAEQGVDDTGLTAPSEADAARGVGGRRRSSLAHALARQNSMQRVQHAGRVANHPLAPPQATLGKTLCATMFATVLIVCIVVTFVEDGIKLEKIDEPCRTQMQPIGLWLKVLVIFPIIDIIPPWINYFCGQEGVMRLHRVLEMCACWNFLGRLGWLILGTSWVFGNSCDLSETGMDSQPMVFQVSRFVIIMSWVACGIMLAVCCCLLPCLIYFIGQENFTEQLARLQPGHVEAADEETIEHIAKGLYHAPTEPGRPGKVRVAELNYEADVESGAAVDCIGLVDYVRRFPFSELSYRNANRSPLE
jgi:hypothetical protein